MLTVGQQAFFFFFTWNVLRAKSHGYLYFIPFFSCLKIKSHYLSTAVLLYIVNNAPPRIFTGLRVHYGERHGHVRKEGLLTILILCVSFSSRTAWACL